MAQCLLRGRGDKTIRLWDVVTKQNIATFEGHRDRVRSVAFLPYGTTLASGSEDGTALLWDVSEYVTPVVNIPDANLRAAIQGCAGQVAFCTPITSDGYGESDCSGCEQPQYPRSDRA